LGIFLKQPSCLHILVFQASGILFQDTHKLAFYRHLTPN